MSGDRRDPRSEAEKARADLMRNAELGMAVPESPLELQPSVTAATFGDTSGKARVRSADQGVEAGGVRPDGSDAGSGESIVEAEQVPIGRDHTAPAREGTDDEDVLSRAKE
jgi:hypothetical protein